MSNAVKFWDKMAAKYVKSPIEDMDAYTQTLERTRSYLSPGDRVLEVGCGSGSTALLLAGDVDHIVASDYSANMIEFGRQKAQDEGVANVSFIMADIFDEALEGEPYDVVLALNLLHLIEDVPGAVTRLHGLLKPGGLFISKTICQPGQRTPFKLRIIKMLLPLLRVLGAAPYVNFMAIAELEQFITAQGFKIIEAGNYPASPPSRYIVARKV